MFELETSDLQRIIQDFGFEEPLKSFRILQAYDNQRQDPLEREFRLILQVDLEGRGPLVVRLVREDQVDQTLVEAQSRFAASLKAKGIETPGRYQAGKDFARTYVFQGLEVIVTVEDKVDGVLTFINPDLAGAMGRLLAQMHDLASQEPLLDHPVLFHPLRENNLFSFDLFREYKDTLRAIDEDLYWQIEDQYGMLIDKLAVFDQDDLIPVQGDLSQENLYLTEEGDLGVFDFNCAGDNHPYYDAIMQAVFVARLMDYLNPEGEKAEDLILSAFLQAYHDHRPFSEIEKSTYPYFYALISTFWLMDLKWSEDSLQVALEAGDKDLVKARMKEILRISQSRPSIPIRD